MKPEDICLLLTGCIAPAKEVYALQLKDSDIRRQQYLEALRFYIEKTNIKKIVFCDNSNAEEIKEIVELALKNKKDFEWIAFQGDVQKTIENGKGYGEGEILKYACENSKLIQTCKYLSKVTGRLKITNLNSILRMTKDNKNYFNIYINRTNRYYADTRFFIIKIEDFHKYLLYEYEKVNDRQGETLEVCFALKIIDSMIPYKRFPTYIGYEGISGSTGLRYTLSTQEKMQIFVMMLKQSLFSINEIYDSMEIYKMGITLDDSIWDKYFSHLSNKNVVIYGAGLVGKRLYKLCIKYCNIVKWIDKDYKRIKKIYGKKIEALDTIKTSRADYIIIAISNSDIFQEIKESIKEYNVELEILWFDGKSVNISK